MRLPLLPFSDSDLKGHLNFTTKSEKGRYRVICGKSIVPCKFLHPDTLRALGIEDDVNTLISNSVWVPFFENHFPIFVELVREFYTTFAFKPAEIESNRHAKAISFRLLDKTFKLSVTQFNVALGLITEQFAETDEYLAMCCGYPDDFIPLDVYRHWTSQSSYDPSKSRDIHLHDRALLYIHRLLAFSFSGRKDSAAILSKAELFFLWCMKENKSVNFGYWIATQISRVIIDNKNLILGSLITMLAVNLNKFDPENNDLHIACFTSPLDLVSLEKMHLIGKSNGVYSFCPVGSLLSKVPTNHFSSSPEVNPGTRGDPTSSHSSGVPPWVATLEANIASLYE